MTSIDEAIQAVREAQGIKEPEKIEEKDEPVFIIAESVGEPATKPGGIIYYKPEQIRWL